VLLLETTNDRNYAAVFGAPVPMTTSVAMALYTSNGTYELAHNGFDIARPIARAAHPNTTRLR